MTATADYDWYLRLLGPWELFRGDNRVHVTIRQQRVIAALAILPARPRPVFAGVLWPESPGGQASGNLRSALWHIRHELPGLLDPAEDPPRLSFSVRSDVAQFRHRADVFASSGLEFDADFLALLTDAELLPGWYEDWICFEQDRIRQQKTTVLQVLAERLLQKDEPRRALEAARVAVLIEPFSETSQSLVIRALVALGDDVAAALQLRRFRDLLLSEFGVEPSPRMRRLVEASAGDRVAQDRRAD